MADTETDDAVEFLCEELAMFTNPSIRARPSEA
jgi:hypothetical protein